jgi:hypothetical protein
LITRINVVLPAPLWPSSPTISPTSTSKAERVDGDQVAEAAGDRLQVDRGHLAAPRSVD